MPDQIRLETGQKAELEGGVVRVVRPPDETPHHFKLTARHSSGGLLNARSKNYRELVQFLAQLEALGYGMVNVSRVEGSWTLT